jgi:hypothetical protein
MHEALLRVCVQQARCAWAVRTRYAGVFTPAPPTTAATHAPRDLPITRAPHHKPRSPTGIDSIQPAIDQADSSHYVPVTGHQWKLNFSEVTFSTVVWCAKGDDDSVYSRSLSRFTENVRLCLIKEWYTPICVMLGGMTIVTSQIGDPDLTGSRRRQQ